MQVFAPVDREMCLYRLILGLKNVEQKLLWEPHVADLNVAFGEQALESHLFCCFEDHEDVQEYREIIDAVLLPLVISIDRYQD